MAETLVLLLALLSPAAGDDPATPPPPPARDASPPRMEYFHVASETLHREIAVGAYLPPGYDSGERRYPTLYFLHGMFGNERKWASRGIDVMLSDLIEEGRLEPMIVICPAGHNSMYVDWKNGKAPWETFLVEELVATVDERFRTEPSAARRGLSGDSMGGYGALNLGFKHPDVFGSVSAHSAAVYPVDPKALPNWILDRAEHWKDVYGWPIDEDHWRENNPLHLAATRDKEALASLAIYFDCGTRDRYGFDQTNAELHRLLEERGIAHEYHSRDGGHGREYFSEHVGDSLAFHDHAFRGNAAAPRGEGGADRRHAEPPREF